MRISILSDQPDTAALLAWAASNSLGNPGTIRFPIVVDFDAQTIEVRRAHSATGDIRVPEHRELLPLIVDLPEVIMAKVGMSESGLAYGGSQMVAIG